MAPGRTSSGRVKVNTALDPGAYELLRRMAGRERGLGTLLGKLIEAEARRRRDEEALNPPEGHPTAGCGTSSLEAAGELAAREAALRKANRRLALLHEIDRAILTAQSPAAIAGAAADGLLHVTDAVRVSVGLWQPSEGTFEVLGWAGLAHPQVRVGISMAFEPWSWLAQVRQGRPAFDEDIEQHPDPTPEDRLAIAQGIRSHLAIPLMVERQVIGHLDISRSVAGRLPDDDLALAQQIADSLAVALHHARLNAEVQERRRQLQTLSRRLVEFQEQERRALSRDLHDTSGQTITALRLGLGSLKRADDCSEAMRSRVDGLLELADTVSEDLHRLAIDLRPSSLDRYGLIPALEQLLTRFRKQTGLEVEFDCVGPGGPFARLPGDAETALYRIVQESLTNIARHAQASVVSVVLQDTGDQIKIVVEDDGRGFDVEAVLRTGRLGLLGMRERAEMLGGTLEIESVSGRGTAVFASVPVRPPDAAGGGLGRSAAPWPAGQQASAGRDVPEPDPRLAEAAELARAKALSDALVDITAGMAQHDNARDLLAFVLARSAEAIGCDYARILLREAGFWVVSDGYRLPESVIGQRLADEDVPVAVTIERTGELAVVDDSLAEGSLPAPAHAWGPWSGASIPLVAGGKFLGTVAYVHDSAAAPLKPSEVDFLERLTALVSLAMDNIQLHEVETRQRDELAKRVDELETLLALLPVGVAIAYDPEGKVIRANPANAQMLGVPRHANVSLNTGELPREADYRVYQGGRELGPQELPMQMAARGRTVRDMVVELIRGDGTSVTLLSSAVPLLDAEGKPRGAVGSFVDITEQRRAQAEAESQREVALEARRTLEALMEYIPEGITIADAPDARIRYVSRYGQDLLGGPHRDRTAGEVAGRWAVYEPDGVTPVREDDLPLLRAIRGGATVRNRELVQVNAQGQPIPLLCNAGPIRDRNGVVTGGIVAWRDVGALKEAQSQREAALEALSQREAALSQSEERYRGLFNAMTEGFALHELICDAGGRPADYRFLAINPAFERLTGLRRDEVEGRLKSEVLPGDDRHWLEIYGRVALTGEAVHFDNYSTALRRWYDVYAYCPALGRFAVIFTEITGRKRAEEQEVRQRALQEGINRVLETALTCETEEEFGRVALAVCERVTGSRFGFIGEINAEGFLDDIAISDTGWELCRVEDPAGHGKLPSGMLVHGIYGRVLLDGKAFFTNDPSAHPDRIGVPPGHLPLSAFLGVPLLNRGKTIGMVGLGNREGGYRLEDQEAAEALAAVIVEALERKRAEEKIRRLNDGLEHRSAELETILSALPNGLIVYDPAGNILRMNDVALNMLGYDEETWRRPVSQRVGITVQAFGSDGRLCERDQYVAMRALRGEVLRSVEQYIHFPDRPEKDFWSMLSAGPICGPEGQLAGAVVTMTNTTRMHEVREQLVEREAALTQTAARLEQANAQLQAQADELRIAAERLDQRVQQRTAELLAANARLSEREAALRYQAAVLDNVDDAIIGMDAGMRITTWNRAAEEQYGLCAEEVIGRHVFDVTRSQISDEERAAALRALATTGRWRGESIHLRRDGTPFWVEGNVIAWCDAQGAITAYATVNRDATERKRTEDQLRASREQLQALSRRLVEVQEHERRYVADQLYNEAAQVLAALRMHLDRSGSGEAASAYLAETQYLLGRVMQDLHHLATHLRPAALDRLGLVSALQQYAKEWGREHGVCVQFEALGLDGSRLDGAAETALYRVVQEALMNVAQHARARTVGILVSNSDGRLALFVEDDGVGFDPAAAAVQGTMGLLGMRERVESVGGRLAIESAPGRGACVIVEVPFTRT